MEIQPNDHVVEHLGIQLSSRYGLAREIKAMKSAIDEMPAPARNSVKSIWCDSKACAVYSMKIKEGCWDSSFGAEFDLAFRNGDGGHNGISIEIGRENVMIDPWWDDDEI
jgi:hypothetical protein